MEAAAFTLAGLFLLLATWMAITGALGVLNSVKFLKCHECRRWTLHPVEGATATCVHCHAAHLHVPTVHRMHHG